MGVAEKSAATTGVCVGVGMGVKVGVGVGVDVAVGVVVGVGDGDSALVPGEAGCSVNARNELTFIMSLMRVRLVPAAGCAGPALVSGVSNGQVLFIGLEGPVSPLE